MSTKKELSKVYEPQKSQESIYAQWLSKKYFHAEVDKSKKPFTIVMPPPNITGQLHMGHAMDNTWQDIIIRFKRMQGYSALWVPGTDHAAIATEAKIVEKMKEDGVTKLDLGRDGFMVRAWEWKEQYGGRIVEQLKKLGCSCDWQRERFTMDENCSKAVIKVFKKLYDDGLIYRGERIINWCPTCKTSISDAEVEYEEKDGFFWHIQYKVAGTNESVCIATTRPETMLGDTAIAVHPDDERYNHLHGKNVILPLVGREIPVVCDTYVDKEFGTGVVKVTPAHDPNDFEIGTRHNLPVLKVMTDDAKMTEDCGKYANMDRYAARKAIIEDLKQGEYLLKTEPHKHNVGACYRCSTVVEPMVSKQWFVKMVPLAEPAIKAVKDKEIKFLPERFEKNYMFWMENTRDWCISRQLWWGHRIPAFYCDACGEIHVNEENMQTCPKCNGVLRQDEDTLDTWFSSALWPFSTLGWPNENSEDYKYFYPTNTLVTGYDIITFWVSRMIFSGITHTGKVPFENVLIHGLVRDAQGRKMSKSLGNGIDPLEIVKDYGADALRFMLVIGATQGNDMRFSDEKVLASRNFANKIWNAARFVMMNLPDDFKIEKPSTLTVADKWVVSKLNTLTKDFTSHLEKYELGLAAQKVQDFIWDVYCDWYIEIAKLRLNGTNEEETQNARQVLVSVLLKALKLLHPFMPFITEEIYTAILGENESIMVSAWPIYDDSLNFTKEETEFEAVMQLIKEIRTVRSEIGAHPKQRTSIIIECIDEQIAKAFENGADYLIKFAFATDLNIVRKYDGDTKSSAQIVTSNAKAFIPMSELVDVEKEMQRLTKEKQLCEKDLNMLFGKLNNEAFTSKAPQKIVFEIQEKHDAAKEKLQKINESIEALCKN